MQQDNSSNSPMLIHDAMRPMVRRRRLSTGLKYAIRMLFVCAIISTLSLFGSALLGKPSLSWFTVVMLLGLVFGAFVAGYFKRFTVADAAIEADKCYGLQDLLLSAIEFERIGNLQPIHELQLADAVQSASQVDPRVIVPLSVNRLGWVTIVSAFVMTSFAFVVGESERGAAEIVVRSPAFVQASQRLTEQARKLDELAEQHQDEALAESAMKIKDAADALAEESTGLGDALAEFSRLQQYLRDQRADFGTETMQSRIQEIAKKLRGVAGLEGVSHALEQLNFQAAALELEAFSGAAIDPTLAESAAAELQELAEQLSEANQEALAETLENLVAGLEEGDAEKTSAAADDLAAQLRKLGKETQADRAMQSQLTMLQESKAELVSGQSIDVPSPKPQQASSEIGSGIDGELDGDPSQFDTNRQQMELAGTLGEGGSNVETSIGQAGDAQARRSYHEIYQQYEKQSRAVLEAEPIPLGHRQTIRRYFQLIRPVDQVEDR